MDLDADMKRVCGACIYLNVKKINQYIIPADLGIFYTFTLKFI